MKPLKLIHGGLSRRWLINDVQIGVATRETLPKSVEVMVFEEDTHLILTMDREIPLKNEHPIRLMTEMYRAGRHQPGTLVRNNKNWYAVVVDLDGEKLCDLEWISKAYRKIFLELEKQMLSVVAIHLLGAIHAGLAIPDAVGLFVRLLKSHTSQSLKEVVLIVKSGCPKAVHTEFKHLGVGENP